MAVELSIDLANATFSDLVKLVDAARTAGVDSEAQINLDDEVLRVVAEGPVAPRPVEQVGQARPTNPLNSANTDVALKFLAELLSGREGRRDN